MLRLLVVLVGGLLLTACHEEGIWYYWNHPDHLEKVLSQCPQTAPKEASCKELQAVASSMQIFAWQIRSNPQEFGKGILKLQEDIASQEAQIKTNPENRDLASDLAKNQEELKKRLIMVKHLEAPGG